MKEKTPQEQTAAARQVDLLVNALKGASADGYWFNISGRMTPRISGHNAKLSPFNALIFGLHADENGYRTPVYISFSDARKKGDAVLKNEKSVPMNWYRWATYVNRANETDRISREQYLALPPQQQASYKAVRQREIHPMFNVEQTTLPHSDSKEFERLHQTYGGIADRGNLAAEERQLRSQINSFRDVISQNLAPIRRSTTGESTYDAAKDAIYIPDQKHFGDYRDYVQELMRQTVAATGHRERMCREGVVMPGGKTPSENATSHERLIQELASAVKMMEIGQPAKLSPESMAMVDRWVTEIQENPCKIDAIESDLNNALDMIQKAEKGEKLETASQRNAAQTEEYRDANRPQVSSAEALILQDILAHGGMGIDQKNFPGEETQSQADMNAFMEKFSNLSYYRNQVCLAMWNGERYTKNPDPEHPDLANVAYTAAAGEAARIYEKCSEWLPREWEQKGSHFIADEAARVPDKRSKEFVVVMDKTTGIADVILPAGARSGGDVVMPNGDKRNYWATPDEVMSAAERKEAGAKVVTHNIPGFNKDKITASLMAQGATYVRFFNTEGILGYRPDDAYFQDKEVYAAKLNGKDVKPTTHFDISEAVDKAVNVQFDRTQMLKDDNGRWALYLKPANEPSFCVYPDKEDINRFFSAVKQSDMKGASEVRSELAQKYYAMAAANPELKTDIFGSVPEGIDPKQIERVNIFRSKDDKILCLAIIKNADKVPPREISQAQWQRLWVAEDVAQYKTALAANLFKEVLLQQGQERTVDKQENEDKAAVRPDLPVVEQAILQQYDQMKQKHPDAILLFRQGDDYVMYKEDAVKAAEVFKTESAKLPAAGSEKEVDLLKFDHKDLDTNLPRLVRAGCRVAICEQLEQNKRNGDTVRRGQTVSVASEAKSEYSVIGSVPGIPKPEKESMQKPQEEESRHKGMRM